MDRHAVRLIIRGRVQGVGYRWWAVETARRLELDGWVRNRVDGSVELVAAGPGAVLDRLLEACWRGPAAASVTSVDQAATEDDGERGFRDRPTV